MTSRKNSKRPAPENECDDKGAAEQRLLTNNSIDWRTPLKNEKFPGIQIREDLARELGIGEARIQVLLIPVGSLTEADFPIERVRQLEDDIRKESAFLKEDVKDELMGIRSDIAQSNQERQQDVNRARRERKEETHELKKQLELHQEETLEKTTAANQQMNENIAELNRKFDDVLNNKKSDIVTDVFFYQEELNGTIEIDFFFLKNRAARETKEAEIHELKKQLEFYQEKWKEETLESRRATDRNITTITAANQEMNENIAEWNRKFDDVLNNKKLAARETKEEIHELKKQLELHQEIWKEETLESRRTTDRNIKTITAANQEMNENIAEFNRKFDDVLKNRRSGSN
ncbi:hypothetical protein OS493_035199 [Desmophyllum pertusum]|uniref:Uncharacterized protein n=1 Tax=Desmophyllum pertusum TaxID=174260 RepID=A0A9X0D8J6_9CNID|nr:hypothetical protein OS493_035199 [Desmophyllum pertusum]